jgi:hypothetical protein
MEEFFFYAVEKLVADVAMTLREAHQMTVAKYLPLFTNPFNGKLLRDLQEHLVLWFDQCRPNHDRIAGVAIRPAKAGKAPPEFVVTLWVHKEKVY